MSTFLSLLEVRVPVGSAIQVVSDGASSFGTYWSNGTPEGSVTADPGSLCTDYANGALYLKVSGAGNTGWSQVAVGSGGANLAIGTIDGNTIQITSDTGTDATIPSATASAAGLMTASDKAKSDFITVTQGVDLDAMEADITEHQTLLGVADGSTDLGTFTGSTIADNVSIKAALQELETAVEGRVSSTLNSGEIFVGSAGNAATPVSLSGDATLSNTGVLTVASASDTVAGKVELATGAEVLTGSDTGRAVTPAGLDGYLTALVGNATGTQHLGAFTGSTIADNVNVKDALQALETALEAMVGGMTFAGTWDATTADPSASMVNSSFLRVSVAGTTSVTTVNAGPKSDWQVGDFLMKDNLGNVHVIDNTDAPISLGLAAITNATLDVTNSSGGSAVTLPAAAPSTALNAGDGTAGVLSGDDKFKLNNIGNFQETYGNGAATAFVINHNLGSTDVRVSVIRVADGVEVYPQIARTNANAVTLTHGIAPTAGQFRVIVSLAS